jgi:hypothetical protein
MPRPLSPAQIANQVTFVLKGHLKNARVGYIRAATLLARVRDEKLWQALDFATIEDYAQARLGLARSSLYRYLRVHDWLLEFHPAWLERRPKGFIPEISDLASLVWIETRLRSTHLAGDLRRDLEAARRKALAGKLTEKEFRELRDRGHRYDAPLRVLLRRLRSLRRFATSIPKLPAETLASIEAAIRAVEASASAADTARRVARHRRPLAAFIRHLHGSATSAKRAIRGSHPPAAGPRARTAPRRTRDRINARPNECDPPPARARSNRSPGRRGAPSRTK